MASFQLAQLLPPAIGGVRPPDSQKKDVRPISFLLVDQSNSAGNISEQQSVTLYIRPEELTVSTPSRLSVQQTMGSDGPWADDFGLGVTTLSISGHTGWRRGNDAKDGIARFLELKSNVIDKWRAARERAKKAGRNPNNVQLIFADALDRFAYAVAVQNFSLRRSRSRPLLMMYNIALVKLSDNVDQAALTAAAAAASASEFDPLSGVKSFAASITAIATFANDVRRYVDKQIDQTAGEFMRQTQKIYKGVLDTVSAGDAVESSVLSIARLTAQSGYNLFRASAAAADIPAQNRVRLMQIAAAYTNIYCLLQNALSQRQVYQDYSALYGASNCSSTSGGRPPSSLADVNPFYLINPVGGASAVQLTPNAQESLTALAHNDVVLSPFNMAQLAGFLELILAGMTVNG